MSFANGHALVIGIGQYAREPRFNTPVTSADAYAIAAALRDPTFCAYPPEQVTLLNDAAATRAGILEALDNLASRVRPEDTVLLYYVGMSDYTADDTYCLACHDTSTENRKFIAETALNERLLLEKLRLISAEKVLLIFNTGKFSNTLSSALVTTGPGRVIIAASHENGSSVASVQPRSKAQAAH